MIVGYDSIADPTVFGLSTIPTVGRCRLTPGRPQVDPRLTQVYPRLTPGLTHLVPAIKAKI